jgi:signal recognition particle receptor subunit beta
MLKNLYVASTCDRSLVYFNRDVAISFKSDPGALIRLLQDVNGEMGARGYQNEETVIDLLTIKTLCLRQEEPMPLFVALTFDDSVDPERGYKNLHQVMQRVGEFLVNKDPQAPLSPEDQRSLNKICVEELNKCVVEFAPKISFIGTKGVGKTTLCRLIVGEAPDKGFYPTITADRFPITLYDIPFDLWDFAGENSERLAARFLEGSDGVVLVLDSSRQNVEEVGKVLAGFSDEVVPHAELLIIANKQDMPEALPPAEIKAILGLKVLPFVATDLANRELILEQIAKLAEIKSESLEYSKPDYIIQRNDAPHEIRKKSMTWGKK